jgi:TolB-like protein/Flp pilus assembly protein TadD
MGELGSADIFEFARFRFDRRGRCLYRLDKTGDPVLLPAGRTALDILGLLVERAGEVVESEEIRRTVWRGKTVEDANLATQIFHLRESVRRDRIQTVSGRGYRFVGSVKRLNGDGRSIKPEMPQNAVPSPPRLSIVVRPFRDLSEDRRHQYFADGITDDLTIDLSRIEDMVVISPNTAFTYRDEPVDPQKIGGELGVRYVLEGTVRRSGSLGRVNARLIDAETLAQIWTERLDRELGDLFALQNEITSQIAVALNSELVNVEARRPTDHPVALDYIFRGRAVAWGKPPSGYDSYAQAIGLFERALMLEPGFVEAQAWLASALANRAIEFPCDGSADDLKRAEELATTAAATLRTPLAHFAKGQALRAQNRWAEAIPEYETVLALNRNWAGAIFTIGYCRFHIGFLDEIIPLFEQAIRLSPRDPYIGVWYARLAMVHLVQSRADEAIIWLEKARNALPARPFTRSALAAAYALNGLTELADAELVEARKLSLDDRYSTIARLKAVGNFGVPTMRALHETTYFTGLRKAGVPEE